MLNVIDFRKTAPRAPELSAQPPANNANVDIAELASRIIGLQSQAKGEIGNAVLMLDLAAQHAREITARIPDPTARKNFGEHIAMIEQLLQVAREMTFKL